MTTPTGEPQDHVPDRRGERPDDVEREMPVIRGQDLEQQSPASHPAFSVGTVVAIFGSQDRSGAFHAGPRVHTISVFGSTTLDLRHAVLDSDVVEVRAVPVLGSVTVVVPSGWDVQTRGIVVLGSTTDDTARSARRPGGRTLIVTAYGALGSVSVQTGDDD